jgi:hypothetical protein
VRGSEDSLGGADVWDDHDRQTPIRLLQAVGMAEASKQVLDLDALAHELDLGRETIRMELEQLDRMGLCHSGLEDQLAPMLLTAGSQFLSRNGHVDAVVLHFLPGVLDDLNAREALLAAGTVLVDEFRAALLEGEGVDHARLLVPPAFAEAVDPGLALDLYAASVALIARLSDGAPAGCVAEEIMAVRLIEEARMWLDMLEDEGKLDSEQARAASEDLQGLFELFQDDDVLQLFQMEEPADAALTGHHPINRQLGVADQRIEAWFDPFAWTAPSGYLNERRPS